MHFQISEYLKAKDFWKRAFMDRPMSVFHHQTLGFLAEAGAKPRSLEEVDLGTQLCLFQVRSHFGSRLCPGPALSPQLVLSQSLEPFASLVPLAPISIRSSSFQVHLARTPPRVQSRQKRTTSGTMGTAPHKDRMSQALSCESVIPPTWRLRQEDPVFKTSMSNSQRVCPKIKKSGGI